MEHSPSDAELLALAPTRPEVLGVLYERHAPAVHRYLSRRVGAAVADDLLGDVFVAAVEGRVRVRPHVSGSALPWLYGIHRARARARAALTALIPTAEESLR
ncbi:RNA polymerase sigma factor [Cellulomonas timonensis]|uniref:RNA polymerase sigma factor n=1 Tax=Cellulomonas timonensis TaxID=1689271 RepID=UPI00082BA1B3|nr:sigma factor [Cellulomonas timonensis]